MDEEGDDGRSGGAGGPSMGPIYLMWENSLEKLKILSYEKEYCKKFNKKPFSRIQFVLPGNNPSVQFDDFISLCSWLFTVIDRLTDLFKPEEFDDPNTIVNKLVLALRQLDFRSAFPSQKIKVAHGEPACAVIDFLVDKALASINFQWGVPVYAVTDDVEQAEADDDVEEDAVEEDIGGDIGEEDGLMFEDFNGQLDTSMDNSTHNILQADVDPVLWKTELERVGPKLKVTPQEKNKTKHVLYFTQTTNHTPTNPHNLHAS
jgi:estrogen-related receptor beta like 1